MASAATANVMAKHLPPEFTDLATAVRRTLRSSVNVIGSVVDWLPPVQSRGSDMQMSFVIRDNSMLPNGLRVKYFKRYAYDFPDIRDVGDIVLLRNIRISMFQNEIIGLSSFETDHIVFPRDHIVSPEFRHQFAVQREFLQHTKSSGCPEPNIHEQQWVITLKACFGQSSEDVAPVPLAPYSVKAQTADPTTSNGNTQPVAKNTVAVSEKFSLIKGVTGGDRDGGNRHGNFYDIAVEVVKMFFEVGYGTLDLYVTDYTINSMLPDRKSGDVDSEQYQWRGPSGRMTLHLELYPPHATWTHQNIKEGDFVFLRNVRIKWNQRGLGTELEGNIWPDKFYADRVYVSQLRESHPCYSGLQARKKSYFKNVEGKEIALAKRKNRKGGRNPKRQKKANGYIATSASPDQSDDNDDPAAEELPEIETSDEAEATSDGVFLNDKPLKNKKFNSNIKCLHPDVPLSTLDVIINNPNRWFNLPTGERVEAPFINVNHRARLRVVDYFPHELKDFAEGIPSARNPDQVSWKWKFWLILAERDADQTDSAEIIVCVVSDDAEDLLQLIACDLSRHPQRLVELEQTLFLLWGELAEQKNKFLHSHPQIKPDEQFSASAYNIKCDNLAFDTCISEYGELMNDESGKKEWRRAFRLFHTRIMK